MQIGSNSSHIPGCAPVVDHTPSAPPPLVPSPPLRGRRRPPLAVVVCLIAGVALVVVVGVVLALWHARERTWLSSAADGIRHVFLRMVYRPDATATNDSVTLTPAQLRLAAEYSPIRPINEAKRVIGLELDHVAVQNTDDTVRADGSATGPTIAGATSTPTVVGSASAPAASRKSKPVRSALAEPAAKKPFVWPTIKVTAAIGDRSSNWVASVNGRLVTVGDTVDGAVVVAISSRCVTLACEGQQRDFYIGSRR